MDSKTLATLRAAGEAATKAPWYRGRRIISAGIEPPGLPELKGTGKCALCHPSRPLHSVVPNEYHSEYTGKTADLHRHIDPNPSGADSKIQSEDGDQVAGAFDYDDGGIVNPADAAFIALARNHWDELLDAAEERDRLRDELAKAEASTEKLERRVVANAGRLSREGKPRWSHVADATAHGSTVAQKLCRDHGLDPDEIVGGGA